LRGLIGVFLTDSDCPQEYSPVKSNSQVNFMVRNYSLPRPGVAISVIHPLIGILGSELEIRSLLAIFRNNSVRFRQWLVARHGSSRDCFNTAQA
jgi:hypothetical protein